MTTTSAMIALNNSRRPKRLRRRRGRRRGSSAGDGCSSSGSGVESDNWRRELLHQAPEEREGIDPGRVAALERDLQGVLADERDVADPELIVVEGLHACQPAWRAGLAATLGARTGPPQLLGAVRAAVPVLPRDLHHLARAVDVDIGGKRIRVLRRL